MIADHPARAAIVTTDAALPAAAGAPAPVRYVVLPAEAGQRLDHFLLEKHPDQSRSSLHKRIEAGDIRVDGRPVKAGYRLRPKHAVTVALSPPPASDLRPERIEFPVLFEDAHLLVINKPPGLVVHPACGHQNGTLVHGLLHRLGTLPAADALRPGIVHRLDKDTSGALLVAKTEVALRLLMAAFKDRNIRKTYQAILLRTPREAEGRIVAPIGRHPVQRKKMAVRPEGGKYALTAWRVVERFANGWCLAEITIETGRTHQIRVHMASVLSPVAGDLLYGGAVGREVLPRPERQMLHASTLRFVHPVTGENLCCTAPLWEDMQGLLDGLRDQHGA